MTRTQRGDSEMVYGPEYRVSIDEALKAYTINVAWQIHKDHMLGGLTENKKADVVILSQNPYKVDPLQLEDIEVIDTFLDGQSINASQAYMTRSVNVRRETTNVHKKMIIWVKIKLLLFLYILREKPSFTERKGCFFSCCLKGCFSLLRKRKQKHKLKKNKLDSVPGKLITMPRLAVNPRLNYLSLE